MKNQQEAINENKVQALTAGCDLTLPDRGLMHQRETHSDAAFADLVGGGVQQLFASTWQHQLLQEQSPRARPSSSH